MVFALKKFWRGLCTNWIGTAGVVLTTSSFVLFLVFELLRVIGMLTNAYMGLITYLSLPGFFVIGLGLIPIGWLAYKRKTGKTTRELLSERFDSSLLESRSIGSKLIGTIALLTLLNLLFLGFGGAVALRFMERPEFCGTACHSVMSPEWTTYQLSPHAKVKCVDCHVGTGAQAELDAKLNGLWQMISVTFDLFERPIPTPVENLRPARETCEKCHWSDMFYGDRIKKIVHYENDRDSTSAYTTLALKVGSGKGEKRGQIHWHVASKNQVRYLAVNPERTKMRWLEVLQSDGTVKRYHNQRLSDADAAATDRVQASSDARIMDCVDCHNRATHIFEDPQDAVDLRIQAGEIDTDLPYARRQALAALTGNYPKGQAMSYIDQDIRGYYLQKHPDQLDRNADAIDRAVRSLQVVYARNVHEKMNVSWNGYPDHLGHRRGPGCRRCHMPDMVDQDGLSVPNHCTLCHSILAYESKTPMSFQAPADPDHPECEMHVYLQREFMGQQAEPAANPCENETRTDQKVYQNGIIDSKKD